MSAEEEAEITKRDVRLSRKLYPSLSLVEISLYTATWISGVYLACHSLYMASQEQARRLYTVDLVRPWWKFWSSSLMKRDGTDHEWETWKTTSLHVGALVVLYPVLSQVCKRFLKDFSLPFSALYSVVVTMYLIGVLPTLYLFLQIVVIWAAYHTNSAKVVWVVSISYILCLNMFPLKTMKDSLFPDHASQLYQGYLTSVLLAWINARCISFALDRIWYKVERETVVTSFLMLTAFCFYLPLGVMGPLVSSKTFKDSFAAPLQPLDRTLCVTVLSSCLRYGVWFTVTDVSLYFLYQQALTLHPSIVSSLNLWALCGMGYFMGQFFQLKYVVMYGWSSFLARLDNVSAPPHPKCIGRIHLYSDMWRYFDNGLYLFMQQYIYLPVMGEATSLLARLCASAVCFSFVYVWHGTMDFVLIWSCLNFLGITCEGVARAVGRNTTYLQWESYCLGHQAVRRLHALLASPLLVMSSLSNFYFFTGLEVGNIFVRRVLLESWPWGLPTIIFFLYCCAQTSIEVKNYEIKRQIMAGRDRGE
eukprot:GFUD01035582.1.p1 GENE.GFUD01035582.1~~GFUD01035582.1.p1  ORF type:complete len:532 (+),score=158.44 GFUD01035582.1:59-1654(+)